MTCVEFAAIVDAYVDRELPAAECAAAAAHAEGCRACRTLVEERLELSRMLGALPYYQAPAPVRAAAAARTRPMLGVPRRLLPLAAGIAAVVALGSAALGIRAAREARAETVLARLAEDVVSAHARALQSGRLFAVASSDRHTVKPWFLGRVDFAPPVEDLASAGFPLAGGRVDTLGGQPEAALIYMRRLHPIDVFIRPAAAADARADARTIRGFQIRHWVRNEMSFWVVSDLAAGELDDFVEACHRAGL